MKDAREPSALSEIRPSDAVINEEAHRRLQAYNRAYMRVGDDFSYHIEAGGEVVGAIVAWGVGDTLEVEYLFVAEACRRRGIGGALLRHAEDAARTAGLRRVLVNTYSFQAPGFYARMGYRELCRISPCFDGYDQRFFGKAL